VALQIGYLLVQLVFGRGENTWVEEIVIAVPNPMIVQDQQQIPLRQLVKYVIKDHIYFQSISSQRAAFVARGPSDLAAPKRPEFFI
jgi:hypothetical protein